MLEQKDTQEKEVLSEMTYLRAGTCSGGNLEGESYYKIDIGEKHITQN